MRRAVKTRFPSLNFGFPPHTEKKSFFFIFSFMLCEKREKEQQQHSA
jgi:hypothetical protein